MRRPVEFPTAFPTSYSPGSSLWHLSCTGEDINGKIFPYLAGKSWRMNVAAFALPVLAGARLPLRGSFRY